MPHHILVADDEEIIRDSLAYFLKNEGYEVETAENGRSAFEKYSTGQFDLIISDIEMPEMKGTELLRRVRESDQKVLFIIITAYGALETALIALREGATDYILKPIEFDELSIKVNRAIETQNLLTENQILKRELNRNFDFSNIIGKSKAMNKIFSLSKTVALTDSTVLITGNSGTGKELIARAIHFNSKRANKPFVAVNCGAIPESLIESELFGHKKGSFTGAVYDKDGFIKTADGGTLLLDEISEMPLQLQVKLLRVLQEKELVPVGTSLPVKVDVRFLATTNRNLIEEIEKGTFREDLYYRINVVELRMPSLIERKEDIPLLVDFFISKYRNELKKNIKGIEQNALRAVVSHKWKGEVRELENIIERACIFAVGEYLSVDDFPDFIDKNKGIEVRYNTNYEEFMKNCERDFILHQLVESNYDKEKVAKVMNMGLSTLYRKIKELQIEL